MTDVVFLRDDQVDKVGAMLGRAFHDDALLVYMIPDDAERRRLAAAHFTPFVRAFQANGDVYVTDDLSAAACWRRPGSRDITPEEAAAAGIDRIADAVGAEAWERIAGVFRHLDARWEALGAPYAWTLGLIGVDEGRKGTGLGSAVISPVLSLADAAAVPCYLETMEARNVPFYERHGFRVVEDAVEPVSGLRYWLLLRPPDSEGFAEGRA